MLNTIMKTFQLYFFVFCVCLVGACQETPEDIIFSNMRNAAITKEQEECLHSEGFCLTYTFPKKHVRVYTCPLCDKYMEVPINPDKDWTIYE